MWFLTFKDDPTLESRVQDVVASWFRAGALGSARQHNDRSEQFRTDCRNVNTVFRRNRPDGKLLDAAGRAAATRASPQAALDAEKSELR
jgi:hypothetical protein